MEIAELLFYYMYQAFFAALPFISVAILGYIAFKMWLHYIQQDFISGIDFVLLEIVPPREVLRNPKAMELFITNALYHWSLKGGMEEYWQGAVWFWFSLELVSIDGQVHFYIRTPTRVRGLIETQMYAQYPQAQVKEVDDYTLAVDEISEKSAWMGWGCEFGLLKPEAFSIKTYVDFGLDKDPKEEYKVDPISPVIELFGSLKKGEQMWMQIVVTPSKKSYHTHGTWFGSHDWIRESELQMKKLLKDYTAVKGKGQTLGTDARVEIRTPDFLKKPLESITRKTSKLGFDTGIRVMYMAKKEVFDMSSRRNLRLIFRQYTTPDANGLNRINSTQADAYNTIFPLSKKSVMALANRMLHDYRERDFFHPPMRHHLFSTHTIPWPFSPLFFMAYKHHQTYVLNTEELATIWHFPGQILQVPSLERIESKDATPPPNLPI
ncbi:hypothetical protein HZA26_03350 [Candidatus Nomurabacteria bacterium]|nr:hypothetical protein [Candidatus Nomurabacteria bacterium]